MGSGGRGEGGRRREEEYREMFKKGSGVEVSSEDSGLRGSWYTATVVRPISSTTLKILVEYHNLYSDDSGSTKLREFVDAVLVRPIPPLQPQLFSLMDDVDAFHNDGWWEGVVTRVFPHHSLYSVFFRCSREQIDFPPSGLRLYREWLPPNLWLPPFLPSPPPSSSSASSRKRKNGNNAAGLVTNNGGARPGMRSSSSSSHYSTPNGLTRNPPLKDPRTRPTLNSGGRASRK